MVSTIIPCSCMCVEALQVHKDLWHRVVVFLCRVLTWVSLSSLVWNLHMSIVKARAKHNSASTQYARIKARTYLGRDPVVIFSRGQSCPMCRIIWYDGTVALAFNMTWWRGVRNVSPRPCTWRATWLKLSRDWVTWPSCASCTWTGTSWVRYSEPAICHWLIWGSSFRAVDILQLLVYCQQLGSLPEWEVCLRTPEDANGWSIFLVQDHSKWLRLRSADATPHHSI